jgi:peptidoglycan-associated lipoprotein
MSRAVAVVLAALGASDLALIDFVLAPAALAQAKDDSAQVASAANETRASVPHSARDGSPAAEPTPSKQVPQDTAVSPSNDPSRPTAAAPPDDAIATPSDAQSPALESGERRTWTLLFPRTRQDRVPSAAEAPLVKIAGTIVPSIEHRLLIRGHTDARGTREGNRELALARAKTVADRLVELGVPSHRIRLQSMGEDHPAVPGHNEEAWYKNRRVEIVLAPPSKRRQQP